MENAMLHSSMKRKKQNDLQEFRSEFKSDIGKTIQKFKIFTNKNTHTHPLFQFSSLWMQIERHEKMSDEQMLSTEN